MIKCYICSRDAVPLKWLKARVIMWKRRHKDQNKHVAQTSAKANGAGQVRVLARADLRRTDYIQWG